jgi:hypothetical protein
MELVQEARYILRLKRKLLTQTHSNSTKEQKEYDFKYPGFIESMNPEWAHISLITQ